LKENKKLKKPLFTIHAKHAKEHAKHSKEQAEINKKLEDLCNLLIIF